TVSRPVGPRERRPTGRAGKREAPRLPRVTMETSHLFIATPSTRPPLWPSGHVGSQRLLVPREEADHRVDDDGDASPLLRQQAGPPEPDPNRLDALVMGRICQGDPRAVAELYDRSAVLAMWAAVTITHDAGDAEDVVHDAFVAILRRADQYRHERGSVAA